MAGVKVLRGSAHGADEVHLVVCGVCPSPGSGAVRKAAQDCPPWAVVDAGVQGSACRRGHFILLWRTCSGLGEKGWSWPPATGHRGRRAFPRSQSRQIRPQKSVHWSIVARSWSRRVRAFSSIDVVDWSSRRRYPASGLCTRPKRDIASYLCVFLFPWVRSWGG